MEKLKVRESDNKSDDLYAAQMGLFVAAVGTLIWGYGDLIERLVAFVSALDQAQGIGH